MNASEAEVGGAQVAAAAARKVEKAGGARRIRVDQRALDFVVVVFELPGERRDSRQGAMQLRSVERERQGTGKKRSMRQSARI